MRLRENNPLPENDVTFGPDRPWRLRWGLASVFRRKTDVIPFYLNILIWATGIGCFGGAMNNFFADIHSVDGGMRGVLEVFRELPGFVMIFLLLWFRSCGDWKIMTRATLFSMFGAVAMMIPFGQIFHSSPLWFLAPILFLWSTGEHLMIPVRNAVAMTMARPGGEGRALGLVNAALQTGYILGCLVVWAFFEYETKHFGGEVTAAQYNVVWGAVIVFMALSLAIAAFRRNPDIPSRRPKFLIRRRFGLYYAIEFYTARVNKFF